MTDRLLIIAVFVVASCGLAYELIAGALSSYLLGDSILQFSTIIGSYLFAMGIGAHLSRYVRDEDAIARFVDIELAIGLFGGLSAAILFLTFAWLAAPFRTLLYGFVLVIGMLVGMEIPLVMRLLGMRKVSLSDLVSRVLTFDYLGALAVSLLFPLVLAPRLGLIRSALLFGLLNVVVALWTIHGFRAQLSAARGQVMRASVILALLLFGFTLSDRLTAWGEHGMFGDEIVHATSTPYQRLVITRWKDDLRLYINGNLQFSSRDEHRYHEALVHPGLETLPWARNVLVLGGGDGLALREVLRYPNVTNVTLVDLDREMTSLFSTAPDLVQLNQNSFHNPRVRLINADAAQWLEQNDGMFDYVVADFPDPSNFSLGKLFSVPFYRLLKKHVAANGLVVVQSTSPYYAPHAFWSIDATLREAGFRTSPYHAYVPSFGEWGFVIAAPQRDFTPPEHYRLPMHFLDVAATREMFRFPADMPRLDIEPNRLNNQSLVRYFEEDWHRVIR
ncbi:MAG TPA: polyamine aminopropyltransferase [Rhodocyclaceae bacterium]|nr:polyamine aminopropyltransferase [Rhodocyclaceae bacterium]